MDEGLAAVRSNRDRIAALLQQVFELRCLRSTVFDYEDRALFLSHSQTNLPFANRSRTYALFAIVGGGPMPRFRIPLRGNPVSRPFHSLRESGQNLQRSAPMARTTTVPLRMQSLQSAQADGATLLPRTSQCAHRSMNRALLSSGSSLILETPNQMVVKFIVSLNSGGRDEGCNPRSCWGVTTQV